MNTINFLQNQNKTFMSLSKISYGYGLDPKWAAEKWLSEPTTLEFIELWERLHNLDFKNQEYIELCSTSLSLGCSPNVEEMQKMCCIKGLFVDKEYDGDIYLHKDLALDFATWISPAFRTFCLLLIQQSGCDMQFNFNSEEDFVVSNKTLAMHTQKHALENYQKSCANFVYNCTCV